MVRSGVILLMFFMSASVFAEVENLSYKKYEKIIKKHDSKVLIVFWATYCPHCLKELETIADNYEFFSDSDIKVIGIAKDKSGKILSEFLNNKNYPFKNYMITEGLKNKMNIRLVPITAVYDESGNLDHISPGRKRFGELKSMISN